MNWVPVYGSSNVESVRYDEASRQCQVKFVKGGDVYTYYDVSPEEWQALLNAGSKGRFVQIVFRREKQYRREESSTMLPVPQPDPEDEENRP
jgi:hypothetical protein